MHHLSKKESDNFPGTFSETDSRPSKPIGEAQRPTVRGGGVGGGCPPPTHRRQTYKVEDGKTLLGDVNIDYGFADSFKKLKRFMMLIMCIQAYVGEAEGDSRADAIAKIEAANKTKMWKDAWVGKKMIEFLIAHKKEDKNTEKDKKEVKNTEKATKEAKNTENDTKEQKSTEKDTKDVNKTEKKKNMSAAMAAMG